MHNGTTATCRHLATLRDSLLPRLLSGAVRVQSPPMRYEQFQSPFLVLDRNALEGQNALDAQARADALGVDLLFPDSVFLEIVRQANWQAQFEYAFKAWAGMPDRLNVAKGAGELMRAELATKAAMKDIVDHEMTKMLRQTVAALSKGDVSFDPDLPTRVEAHRKALTQPGGQLDAKGRLQQLRGLLGFWQDRGPSRFHAAIAPEAQDPTMPLVELGSWINAMEAAGLLNQSLAATPYAGEAADKLLSTPSYTGFRVRVLEAYTTFLWARGETLPADANEQRHLNQLIDLDYATLGLCCKAFQTADDLARRIEQGLRQAFIDRWRLTEGT